MKKLFLLLGICLAMGLSWGLDNNSESKPLIIFKDLAPATGKSGVLQRFGNCKYSASAQVATIVTLFLEKPSKEVQNEYAIFDVTSTTDGLVEFRAKNVRLRKKEGLNTGSGTSMHAGTQIEGAFNDIKVKSAFLSDKHTKPVEKDVALFVCSPWLDNARHVLQGEVKILSYSFSSDEQYPLIFKLVRSKGYVYLSGQGTVKKENGKSYSFGTDDSIEKHLGCIASNEPLVREGSSLALGYLSSGLADKNNVFQALIKLFKDDVPDVRIAAVESLGCLHAKEFEQYLKDALADEKNEGVKLAIKDALKSIQQ